MRYSCCSSKKSMLRFRGGRGLTSNRSTCILGIDEAGRGPVFGPLVVAAFACPYSLMGYLKDIGVRDSKVLSKARREELYEQLIGREDCFVDRVSISSGEIDRRRGKGESLNDIERIAMVTLFKRGLLNQQLVVHRLEVDSVESNGRRFAEHFSRAAGAGAAHVEIVCEPQADVKYVAVGAASIVAKVER